VGARGEHHNGVVSAPQRFSVAHVTPFPWEAHENEVNAHVRELAGALSARGHRVLVLAPSSSPERVRSSRRELRAARAQPDRLLADTDRGTPRVLAIGEVLGAAARRRPLPVDVARTLEELLELVPLDFVHVHQPFALSASSAALRYSRALNIGSFYEPTERSLARRFMDILLARLDARIEGALEAEAVERLYAELAARRHDGRDDEQLRALLARRPLIDVDLHMHTNHSHDCATPVEVLLATAREQGLGAIAVTDHNEISGAHAAREQALGLGAHPPHPPHPPVKVIVGEEVKTAEQGEVIGLFIEHKIPRGLSMAETVAEIKRQGGLVYVPHPFDRMHAVPDYEHLLPILDDVDAIEVFNPRVAIGAFNEEAARFAAKYRIPAGAGSDSHVAQGLGSVRIRMRDFDGPQEFLQSLSDAEIVTKPGSLIYVQALKFLQTRVTRRSAAGGR
jgi:predicted metal-dependent phosphoesterase TrpH